MSAPVSQHKNDSPPTHCLVHAVAHLLATETALEAVTLDQDQQAISLAFLGNTENAQLSQRVQSVVAAARISREGLPCGLLAGESACQNCKVPFAPYERQSFRIQHDTKTTTISRVTCPTSPRFWHWSEIRFPKLVAREVELPDEQEHAANEWKAQLAAAALCGVFAIAATLQGSPHHPNDPAKIFWFILSYVFGSWFTAKEVLELFRKGRLDVHFLMLAVALGSACIGAWGEGATLLFLFSFSGALEHYALGRTQREISSLFKAAPKVATRLEADGRESEIPVEQLQTGMRLLIKPDSQFPVDAEVVKGQTAADESHLTGEAIPVEKKIGDTVLAGTLNQWGVVEVNVLRPASESSLQKIIKLIHEAQHLKAPTQQFTDQFGTKYTYGILTLSLAMFFIWWLVLALPPFVSTPTSRSAFYQAMALLVVASPCALVLSIPSAVLAAIAWGARHGILFRGGAAVEKLAEITVVALDKTGTLTTGELRVESTESFPQGREKEVAQLAYSLEKLSAHPLARAITRDAKQKGIQAVEMTNVESFAGQGLRARWGRKMLWLGRRSWLADKIPEDTLREIPLVESGASEVWLVCDGLVGRILLRDDLRPEAQIVIAQLRQAGLKTIVLTGDRRATGEFLKTKIAVDEVRSELKPADKVAAIQSFLPQGQLVAMIGDGVNDAPSLAAAHVGVAMGARGSDAALEQADVVLMHDRLENFWAARQISQKARQIIRQNLTISLGTVAVLASFALFGAIPLTVGVIGHEGSTVLVVLNSLRLLFQRKNPHSIHSHSLLR